MVTPGGVHAVSCAPRALQLIVKLRMRHQMPQHRQPRRHRQRISRKRPRLIHRTQRRDLAHDVGASAVGRHRQAAADNLAERRQIRPDAETLLRAAQRHAEARHHFVENQQRAVTRGQFAQRFEKSRRGRNAAHVADHRLDDHRGDLRRRAPRTPAPRRRSNCNGSAIVVSANALRNARAYPRCPASPCPSLPSPAANRRARDSSLRT